MIRNLVRIRCCVVLQELNCHGNYHAGFPTALPVLGRQISGYSPASGFRTTLTRISPCYLFLVASSILPLPCRLFLVTSSLSPHLVRFIVHPVGHPRFRLRGSVGLAVGLAIKWPAALPSSAAGPSRRRSSYCRSSHRRLSHRGSGPSESDYCKSNSRRSTHCGSTHCGLSHRRCDVNKKQGHFGGRKNDRLMIGKKPFNPVGTEEKNQGRKDLVVVQSFRINLCD